MSKYTVTLKEYVESSYLANYTGTLPPIAAVVEMTDAQRHTQGRTLFPTNFPFYNNVASDKTDFMDKFVEHFYFHEIGQETIGQFKWYLRDFLNTRMPYYTELYNSKVSSLADALQNINLTVTESGQGRTDTNNTNTSSSSEGSNGTSKELQFPLNDGTIQEISRSENTDSSNSQSLNTDTGYSTNSNSKTQTTSGMMNQNKLSRTKEYRDLIININELIFQDAIDYKLFLQIW